MEFVICTLFVTKRLGLPPKRKNYVLHNNISVYVLENVAYYGRNNGAAYTFTRRVIMVYASCPVYSTQIAVFARSGFFVRTTRC